MKNLTCGIYAYHVVVESQVHHAYIEAQATYWKSYLCVHIFLEIRPKIISIYLKRFL